MCPGIILKTGDHLQTVRQAEDHFKVDLSGYNTLPAKPLIKDCCLCQIDLERFMNEPERKELFEYDYVEYYEK